MTGLIKSEAKWKSVCGGHSHGVRDEAGATLPPTGKGTPLTKDDWETAWYVQSAKCHPAKKAWGKERIRDPQHSRSAPQWGSQEVKCIHQKPRSEW